MPATAPGVATDSSSGRGVPAATVEDCLRAVADGQLEPFARLYDLTAARVYGTVLQVLRNRARADEITRAVYLSVWRQAAEFNPSQGSGIGWVLTIAHRRAVDQVRRDPGTYRRNTAYAGADVPSVNDKIDALAGWAFARLTEPQRRLIDLAYFRGRTLTEIGSELGLPPGSAAAGIRNALTRLYDTLPG